MHLTLPTSRKTWFVSDWHLGEETARLELMGRPFKTRQEHIDHLLMQHNALVGKDDLVINGGDVCYQNAPEFLHLVSQFNGEKVLIRGNHDRVFTDEQLRKHFTAVVPEGDGIIIEGLGFPCFATHYPSLGLPSHFNIVAHIHNSWKHQLNMVNVGVDVCHFRPTPAERISFFRNAITNIYDEDVWVAYSPVNSDYRGKRGKPGTYFKANSEAKPIKE